MDSRTLAHGAPTVSALGLGCMGMSGTYGPAQDAESLRALELGTTFFDTADYYGAGHDGSTGICGTPEYVRSACEGSLKRLGIDTIDLYYQHRVDLSVPIEETVGAMAELVAAGKVRTIGLSEAKADEVRRAAAVHPIAAYEREYSLFSRDHEDEA